MTIVRLGYVAMSMVVKNCSPSQTMTYAQFAKIPDREAAIRKLERIAQSNIENCLRLLKHNLAHDIHFFRLSSRLIPLANHEEISDWDFMEPLKDSLHEIKVFLNKNPMRVDFHPDHFVLLNSTKVDVLNNSLKTLVMHKKLLKGMGINPVHRCVLHVGGAYKDKEKALEQFILNWGQIPRRVQDLIMLENDDTSFQVQDTLYLCQKLGIPLVFDYHHHLANHEENNWIGDWERIVGTWAHSELPIKMHISSPKSEKQFRHHADYIDAEMFMEFLNEIKGSVNEIDCMIEAKQKDKALFQLVQDLKNKSEVEFIDQSSFIMH
ncbi:UV DNA damage repair endonuclease UvsE [Bacillus sp. Marseille-P3661]|uniref:UV DNA damage repair endonuclease UvsE n=1 Tax=Bacillus sp. Marseille-P3661 TaxID=1936234 RepID=UPI000C85E0F5|nr:UV DNA damage repair endonuclease UvsE [Bacillus sp. Marseille-P3661]